jgi:hypothetical protein
VFLNFFVFCFMFCPLFIFPIHPTNAFHQALAATTSATAAASPSTTTPAAGSTRSDTSGSVISAGTCHDFKKTRSETRHDSQRFFFLNYATYRLAETTELLVDDDLVGVVTPPPSSSASLAAGWSSRRRR